MAPTSTPTPFAFGSGDKRSAGQRVPQTALVHLLAWLGLLTLLALCWIVPAALPWSVVRARDNALAALIVNLASPMVWRYLWWGALSGLLLIGIELATEAAMMVCQRLASYQARTTYLRIRTPAPAVRSTALGPASRSSGDAFFRSIQGVIPIRGTVTLRERFFGAAPYAAFTLTGLPDQPIETGVLIGDSHDARRSSIATAIRTVIEGQSPGTLVEVADDPLASLPAGAVVVSRELMLRMPAFYPIRAPGDPDAADLLGPLVSALAPRGTLRSEIQLIVRPRGSRSLIEGWRARATRALIGVQGKERHALSQDARSLEAKLDAIPYAVTVRVLFAVATPAELPAANAALTQLLAVMQQYAERTGNYNGGADRSPE